MTIRFRRPAGPHPAPIPTGRTGRTGTILMLLAIGGVALPAAAAAAPGTVALGGPAREYSGEPISLDVKGADLEDFLRLVAEVSDLNVVVDPSARGQRVTVSLRDVPWDQALDLVLRAQGLVAEREGSVLRIAPVSTLVREKQQAKQLEEARDLSEPLVSVARTLSYGSVTAAEQIVQDSLSPRGSVIVDERTNTILIRDVASRVEAVAGRVGGAPRSAGALRARRAADSPALVVEAQLHAVMASDLPPALALRRGVTRASLAQTAPLLEALVRSGRPPLSARRMPLSLDEVAAIRLDDLDVTPRDVRDVALSISPRRDGRRTVLTVRDAAGAGAYAWHAEASEPQVVVLPGTGTVRHLLLLLPT